jgi:hypothetical protein
MGSVYLAHDPSLERDVLEVENIAREDLTLELL